MIWFSRLKGSLYTSAVVYAIFILPLSIWLLAVYGVLREVYPMPALARYAVGSILLAPVFLVVLDLLCVTLWCVWGLLFPRVALGSESDDD